MFSKQVVHCTDTACNIIVFRANDRTGGLVNHGTESYGVHLPEMELKIPPTNPQASSTIAFQLTDKVKESTPAGRGNDTFQITPSSQQGILSNTRRPWRRLSQNSEHAKAAQVQTKIILEYAGSSRGSIYGNEAWNGE